MFRRIHLVGMTVLPLLLGQSCVPAPKPDPLEVNDTLRQACPSLDDAKIRTLLIAIQTDEEQGFTKVQELQGSLAPCRDPECITCNTAAIEQVYSR